MNQSQPATILQQIVAAKRVEVERAREGLSAERLEAHVADLPPTLDFFGQLAADGPIRLIAEVKRASPSRGLLRADFDPVCIACTYQQHGAACISVLTDTPYFQGELSHLQQIRQAVHLPLLRKDFIIDRYQLLQARSAGADAVLLIAECLDDCQLRSLHRQALDLDLCPLVEIHEPANVSRALEAGASLIGINNRDLHTFTTNLEHTLQLLPHIPDHCLVVAESGIHSRDDVRRLEESGVRAILVGEQLMISPDIGQAVDRLLHDPPPPTGAAPA